MKRTNRFLLCLLAALLAAALGLTALAAEPYGTFVDGGCCGAAGEGTDLTWELTRDWSEEFVLTFSGCGPIRNYGSAEETPFADYREQISRVVIREGVTRVGDYAVAGLSAARSIRLPRSLRSVGEYAIDGCAALEQIIYAGYEHELDYVAMPEQLGDLGGTDPYGIGVPAAFTGEEPPEWDFRDGVLTVSGAVVPSLESADEAPWADVAAEVREIRLADGMVGVGDYAFAGCVNAEQVSVPLSLLAVGDRALPFRADGPEIRLGGTREQSERWLQNLRTGDLGGVDPLPLIRCAEPYMIAGSPFCGYYDEETGDWANAEWLLSEDGVLTVSGSGPVDDYLSADDTPFAAYRNDIVRAVIDEGVTRVGSYAFAGLARLKTLSLPLSLQSIGEYALDGCISLERISYPGYHYEAERVGLPENIGDLGGRNIGDIGECLSEIPFDWSLQNGVLRISGTVIPDAANADGAGMPWSDERDGIGEVRLEEGVARIGDYAFAGMPALTRLHLPSTLREAGENVCWKDRNLSAVYCAFDEEKSARLDLLDRLGRVGPNRHALPGERFFAEQIICLGGDVHEFWYEGCRFLRGSERTVLDCTLSDSAAYAFPAAPVDENGQAVASYEIAPFALQGGDWTESSAGKAHSDDSFQIQSPPQDYLLRHHDSHVTSLTVPGSVSVIRPKAFMLTPALQSVSLPDGLKEIGAAAFAHSGLKRAEIPDSVDVLGSFTFYQSDLSEGVRLPEGIKALSLGMLMETNLTEVTFPASLEHTGEGAFCECRQLTDIRMNDGLKVIDDWSLYHTGVASVALPDTLVRIGQRAMCNLPLTALVLPESLERIGDYAFTDCGEMKRIQLPANLKWIGSAAFDGCEKLEAVVLPEGVKFDGSGVCRSTVLTMEPNVWWGFQSVFAFCKSLKEIVLPESVTEIGSSMFWNCTALERIEIKGDVKYIPDGAFFNCKALKEIFFSCPELYFGVSWTEVTHYTGWDVNNVPEDRWRSVFSSEQYPGFHYTGDIYYNGTPEQWAAVRAPKDDLSGATVHFPELRTLAATCTRDGYADQRMYSDSDYVITPGTVLPATGHHPETVAATEATATEHGYTEGTYCAGCGTWFTGHEVIHNTLGAREILREPTATEAGECIITCTVCGEQGLYAMEPVTHGDPQPDGEDPAGQQTGSGAFSRIRRAMKSIIEFFLRLLQWFGKNRQN